MLDTSSPSDLLPLPTKSFSFHTSTYHTLSTYYHNTTRSLENLFTFNLGKPQSTDNLGQSLCTCTISRENTTFTYNIIIFTFIQYFSRRIILIITPGLEQVHLHLLLHHQDGAVSQKRWRNSIGFTVLIIIISSPGTRTGFMLL